MNHISTSKHFVLWTNGSPLAIGSLLFTSTSIFLISLTAIMESEFSVTREIAFHGECKLQWFVGALLLSLVIGCKLMWNSRREVFLTLVWTLLSRYREPKQSVVRKTSIRGKLADFRRLDSLGYHDPSNSGKHWLLRKKIKIGYQVSWFQTDEAPPCLCFSFGAGLMTLATTQR